MSDYCIENDGARRLEMAAIAKQKEVDRIETLTAKLAEVEARERDAYARGFEEALEMAGQVGCDWANGELGDKGIYEAIRAIPLPDKEGGDT